VIIGFTGTREGMSIRQRQIVRAMLSSAEEVHHGDCMGSDEEFHELAQSLAVRIVIHPPDDPKLRAYCEGGTVLPTKPYLIRNRDIVDMVEFLIATPKEQTEPAPGRGQGTWSAVRYARGKRKPCAVIKPDGAVDFVLGLLIKQ